MIFILYSDCEKLRIKIKIQQHPGRVSGKEVRDFDILKLGVNV